MKILDKYILKSYLSPFFATFLIVLFVLVMQALWLAFDDIAGKGIDLIFILQFLFYTALIVTPQALPIAVLLSSIMALGNLAENYEFAAIKSAGISLQRLVRPLLILTILLSLVNFLFLNNVFTYATFKQKSLYVNIKKKKPALALVAGSFNTEIPGYHIKFDKKYGEDENLLENVLIYDLSENKGNNKIITAEKGKIISEKGSLYMTLVLNNGNFFEDHVKGNSTKMPSSTATFDEYEIKIDISSFTGEVESDESIKSFQTLSLNQLKDTLPAIKIDYDQYLEGRALNLYRNSDAKNLYAYPDSLINTKLKPVVLDNFDEQAQLRILIASVAKSDQALSIIKSKKTFIKFKRNILNKYETEFYNRIAFSLSCLILFFIGAPLGSIIRKGGFGLPMILAICIYVVYFFTNTFGRNLAEESSVSALLGSWISAIIMIPFAFLLTRRATKDRGIFNIDVFLQPITRIFKNIKAKGKANAQNNDE